VAANGTVGAGGNAGTLLGVPGATGLA
jgi:hypothetical protein